MNNLLVDSFIIGIWTNLISYSFWPTTTLNIAILMDNLTSAGPKLLFQGILSTVLGIVFSGLVFGFNFSPESNLITSALSAGCTIFFILLVSLISHRIKLKYKNAKLKLEIYSSELKEMRDKLWGEMQLAKKIQTILLPVGPSINGFELSCYMKPAEDVTGDYYDIINCDNRDWVMIGDVSGHGVPAGLIMMMVQASLRSLVIENENIEPSELLRFINKAIGHNLTLMNMKKFMTITAIALSSRGEAVLSGRHEDILLYEAATKEVKSIRTDGICLSNWKLGNDDKNISFSLNQGDTMLLYTDGIIDSRNRDDQMFSVSGLLKVFEEAGHKKVDEIKEDILLAIQDYNLYDDATLIVIKKS
jgi:serine phosphatase RsbU (regulator of sigma subunit)